MSEITALQATDRAVPLPPRLRREAFALFMDLPQDVDVLIAAEAPRMVSKRLSDTAYVTLMTVPKRQRRPMILRLLAASLAVALPVTALLVSGQAPILRVNPHLPSAFGPGRIYKHLSGPESREAVPPKEPSAVGKPTLKPVVQTPSGPGDKPERNPDVGRTRPPRRPPPPPQKDLVTTVVDQVKQVTAVACDVAAAVVPLCGAEQQSPPILGPSG